MGLGLQSIVSEAWIEVHHKLNLVNTWWISPETRPIQIKPQPTPLQNTKFCQSHPDIHHPHEETNTTNAMEMHRAIPDSPWRRERQTELTRPALDFHNPEQQSLNRVVLHLRLHLRRILPCLFF